MVADGMTVYIGQACPQLADCFIELMNSWPNLISTTKKILVLPLQAWKSYMNCGPSLSLFKSSFLCAGWRIMSVVLPSLLRIVQYRVYSTGHSTLKHLIKLRRVPTFDVFFCASSHIFPPQNIYSMNTSQQNYYNTWGCACEDLAQR